MVSRGRLDRVPAVGYGPALRGPWRVRAQVAQLVEHATENRSVGGSIPPLGTISLSFPQFLFATRATLFPKRGKSPGVRRFFTCPDAGHFDSNLWMIAAPEISGLSNADLRRLVVKLLSEVADLKRMVAAQGAEIVRLKGLKGRPDIKPPGGMETGTTPQLSRGSKRRGRGKLTPRVSVEEQVVRVEVPPGSRFKGYDDFVVQEAYLRARTIPLSARALDFAGWADSDRAVAAGWHDGPLRAGAAAFSCWRNTIRGRSPCHDWWSSCGRSVSAFRSGM